MKSPLGSYVGASCNLCRGACEWQAFPGGPPIFLQSSCKGGLGGSGWRRAKVTEVPATTTAITTITTTLTTAADSIGF